MPDSISSIVELTRPYMTKAAGQRPLFIKTLAEGLEIEIKIPIHTKEDVLSVMDNLLPYALCGAEHRSETHYVYSLEDGAHLNRMFIKDTGETWLKKKSKNKPITTPRYKLPAVCRFGEKLKLTDPQYQKTYKITTKLPPTTSFEKECLNFFYTYKSCIFSLSFSLAWSDTGFLKQEMELEYEGHTNLEMPPSRSEIEAILESMFIELVPASLHSRIHAETKYESLIAGIPFATSKSK